MYNFLDRLIIGAADAGIHGILYTTINMIAIFVAIFINSIYSKRFKCSIKQGILISILEVVFIILIALFIQWAETKFTYFGRKDIVVSFAYLPLVAYLCSKLFKKSYAEMSTFMVFPPLLMHAIGKIGCIFPGCCYGYLCGFGIYNVCFSQKFFPIQLLESLLAFIIIVVLKCISRKQDFIKTGLLMPLMLITYGMSRFLTEFLHDNKKIYIGISSGGFHALFIILVGILLLLIMIRRNKLRSEHYVSQKS